jgi:hypothetical protein
MTHADAMRRRKGRKMTIDEAIKICEEDAEKIGGNPQSDRHAERCRQLAEWLTELKELRDSVGAVKLSDMKEALELIRKYKAENIAQKKLIAEYKRLLKLAVEDISKMSCNNDTHSPDSCYICDKHGNCSYADSFKWCKADEVLKLIGAEENET